jgi:hypothetical protein
MVFAKIPTNFYERRFLEPNLGVYILPHRPRPETVEMLELYAFKDNAGRPIEWTPGQVEIIDCILHRSSPEGLKRIQVIASTQYGKSLAVAAGVVIRASVFPEKWAIVAGTDEKAKIIMEYVIMFALNNPIVRETLEPETPLDRLRMKKSASRLGFKGHGEVRVYSANATRVSETSTALMGFGAQNVVEDESALVNDTLQATVMRMLGGHKDNLLIKIGNPFNRNHFLRTWEGGNYYRIFIDYERALQEGRYTKEFIEEMRQEALFSILYECKFSAEGSTEAGGWMVLLSQEDIRKAFIDDEAPFGRLKMGNDVAGGGRNYSVSVIRGYNMAKKIYKEHEPDTMLFVTKITENIKDTGTEKKSVYTDTVGVGKGATDRLRQLGVGVAVNAGEEPTDKKRFLNKRAEMYWRAREWVLSGGKLSRDEDWLELNKVKYKIVDSRGKIQIMPKEQMLKEGVDSPDVADALSFTFYSMDLPAAQEDDEVDSYNMTEVTMEQVDPYARTT